MLVVYAPDRPKIDHLKMNTIFLAGSIEMGVAEKWQDRLAADLSQEKVILYNPRRPDWDSSWQMDPSKGTKFREQVDWEQDHLAAADICVFYFDPKTQSPITLLELGHRLGRGRNIVCCPEDYFRHGNVKIMCDRQGTPITSDYDDFVKLVKKTIRSLQ